jgi:hypothetical protein
MDKNGARGRAEKTVSSFLEGCLTAGMVESILSKHYEDKDVVTAIKQEIQNIANEHAELAEIQRIVEHGESVADKISATKAKNVSVRLFLGNEEDETEGQYGLSLYALGEIYGFDIASPIDALKLYNALLNVTDMTAG